MENWQVLFGPTANKHHSCHWAPNPKREEERERVCICLYKTVCKENIFLWWWYLWTIFFLVFRTSFDGVEPRTSPSHTSHSQSLIWPVPFLYFRSPHQVFYCPQEMIHVSHYKRNYNLIFLMVAQLYCALYKSSNHLTSCPVF